MAVAALKLAFSAAVAELRLALHAPEAVLTEAFVYARADERVLLVLT